MSVFNAVRGRAFRPRAILVSGAAACALLGSAAAAGADVSSSPVVVTPGGSVPATLSLSSVTGSTALGSFAPGVAQTYTASVTATVTSTAAATALTATDTSVGSPSLGHLSNGAFFLPTALKAGATSTNPAGTTTNLQSLSGVAATLLNYNAPVTGDPITVTFSQQIGATDPLRTGSYGASITLTLTSTTP